jgi:ribose transport system ATP-binding protein
MSKKILELIKINKHYPGVQALKDISLDFRRGEVHAIVGENGAGKSTLIKILAGAVIPDSGEILFQANTYTHLTPKHAMELGITAIYQEFNLIPPLTIAENIFYGREYIKRLFLDRKTMNNIASDLCREMEIDLNPKQLVKDIGVAYQQIVEIVKAVSQNAKILIMDEPTAPLTNTEIQALFRVVRNLQNRGVTIIYISHRLEEIFEICDRVSVLRDGEYVVTKDIKTTNREELVSYMVGRTLGEDYPEITTNADEIVLEVNNISNSKLSDISFNLKKGEILGFGGLVGAGRTELGMAIFGSDSIDGGEIVLKGKKANIKSPLAAIKKGIGLLPEDRKQHGLLLELSIKNNITLGILDRITKNGFIINRKEIEICNALKNELRIKTPNFSQLVRNLSGGNQQKVVLAKWLASQCDVLIFDEPTRGIDVGAKQEIYNLLRKLAEEGKSIIMISSEMPELIGMSNRIIVMYEGRIMGELKRNEFSQERILNLASGKCLVEDSV